MPCEHTNYKRTIIVWSPTKKEMIIDEDALHKSIYDPAQTCEVSAQRLASALNLRVTVTDKESAHASPDVKE